MRSVFRLSLCCLLYCCLAIYGYLQTTYLHLHLALTERQLGLDTSLLVLLEYRQLTIATGLIASENEPPELLVAAIELRHEG